MASQVVAIGVSGQQHGLVVLDGNDEVVRPAKLWCDTSTATEAEVQQVLADLDCADLLSNLANGLQTSVGERGASLSLGQRQLVCFSAVIVALQ